jgi:hypothetical protein
MNIGVVENQEERRKKDRRIQKRRDVENRYVFFDRLFKALFVAIIILIGT